MPASGTTEHRIKNFLNADTLCVRAGRGTDTPAYVHLEQRAGSMSFSFIVTSSQARMLSAALLIAASEAEANSTEGARA